MEDIEIQERPTGYVPLQITEHPLERLLEATNGYPNQTMDSTSWTTSRFKLFRPGGYTLQSSIKVLGAVYWVSKDIIFEKNGKTLRKEFECLSLEPYRLIGFAKRIKCFYTHPIKEDIVGIPRFLGLSLFGAPQKDIRTLGNPLRYSYDIASFQLRSEQVSCVEKSLESLRVYGGATIVADCGYGKCLGLNTPILMYDGSIKMVQDVIVGDTLMGDDSKPRNVKSLARGRETMYRVVPTKGDPYVVNESHILSLKHSTTHGRDVKGAIVDISVRDFLALPPTYHGPAGRLLGYRTGARFPERSVPLDPYMLGYWLGDGTSKTPEITTTEPEVVEYFRLKLPEINCVLSEADSSGISYYIKGATNIKFGCNTFMNVLRDLNLLGNKHVPHLYKCNSQDTQLQLLAGFIDADGHCFKSCVYDVTIKDESLADDIIFMVRSLGFAAYKQPCQKTCTNAPGGPKIGKYYRFCIHGEGLEKIPTKLPRKRCVPRQQVKNALVTRIRLERLDEDDYYGFEIDGNHRFLLGDFTVTHNTRTSISLLALLGRKTLILCNRELLMVQWLTNIESLCPQLKISWLLDSKSIFKTRIKVTHGDSPQYYPGVCDASTDVTIGSIETLLENNVPKELLQLYGTIIVDEAHHLAAATLVHALPMLPARYVIGLSATPDRRDGLEHALYWLSGPVSFVYKRLPSITGVSSTVEVRQIIPHGCANRELFRFDGSIAFTEMITAMSEDLHRNQLIVMLLKTLLHEENRQKIICVSSLVHHCDVLFEMCNEIFVGVPMARMAGLTKDTALARGPARIIFATYSLLEEGYDDPDLDTLVLLTPRSRIQQTVGRVERTKVGKARPLVLDITDSFCVFPNMWYKRESFYKSRGFLIHKNIILKHI